MGSKVIDRSIVRECVLYTLCVSSEDLKKVIKEYSDGVTFILDVRVNEVDYFRDGVFQFRLFNPGSFKAFLNTNRVYELILGKQCSVPAIKKIKLLAN